METTHALPVTLELFLAGIAGLIVGSFLNVVVHRLPRILEQRWGEEAREILGQTQTEVEPSGHYSLAWPPSHCPHCLRRLRLRENIPLVSYLLQLGRCRGCGAEIRPRYPILEAVTAAATVAVVAVYGLTITALGPLALTWALIAAAAIDQEHYLLPDSLTLPLLWAGLLWSILDPAPPTPTGAIIGATAGYLAMWSIFHGHRLITGREGMGHGDFKLTAALGAWLGWQALPALVLIAALAGLVSALILALRNRPLDQPIPFGPFLAGAGWLLLLFGHEASQWPLL